MFTSSLPIGPRCGAAIVAAGVLFGVGCDIPLVSVRAELDELCVTRADIVLDPDASGAMELPIGVDELDLGFFGDVETTLELFEAGFTATDLELSSLDQVVLDLAGTGEDGQPLPRRAVFDHTFSASDETTVVERHVDPAIDVTDYWRAEDGQLLVTVTGTWEQRWTADLDLCFSVTASKEIDW